jgi:hypothetical protein
MNDHGLLETLQHLGAAIQKAAPNPLVWDLYSYVVKHGRLWTPAPLPRRIKRGMVKQCFTNAQTLAKRSRRLQYVEGFAFSSAVPFPVHHAWCVDGDTVVDPTWNPHGIAYFGIAYDLDVVTEQLRGSRCVSVLDNWEKGFPMLSRTPTV